MPPKKFLKVESRPARMVGVWLPEWTITAIKYVIRANLDFTMSEFIRESINHRLKREFPEIYERLRKEQFPVLS